MSARLRLLTGALRGIHAPAGAIFLAAGIALATMAVQTLLDYRNALELPGVVQAKEILRADGDKAKKTRFRVRYDIALPAGGRESAWGELPREAWEGQALGATHPVLYLAGEKRVLEPASAANYAGGAVVAVLGVAFAVIGILLLRAPARLLVMRARLLSRGVQAGATVADAFQTNTAVNRVILWRLRYRYRDAAGVEHEGESDLLRPSEASAWPQGATGAVLYDSQSPGSSAWMGGAAAAASDSGATVRKPAARGWLRVLRNLAIFFAALFAAAVAAELFPALKALDAWIAAREPLLLWGTGAAAVLGVFLLVGAAIALIIDGGAPMSHQDVEDHLRDVRDAMALPVARRVSSYRLFGLGAGAAGEEAFPIRDFRRAFATGAVLTDAVWRRRALALLGAALMLLGLFGAFIVLSPLALKILLATLVLYAVVRTAAAFAIAR